MKVNRERPKEAQQACDAVKAEEELKRTFCTDVTPVPEKAREEMVVAPDPLPSYRESGYQEKIEKERSGPVGCRVAARAAKTGEIKT